MIRLFVMAIAAVLSCTQLVSAQGREAIGYGRLINNDLLGDLGDRWQSGSVASSRLYGAGWDGELPDRPFDILEFRLGGQVITPQDLRNPPDGDRPFAGVLSLGLHTHFERGGNEITLGGDLVFTGPQTRLSDLHTGIHDMLGQPPARPSVLEDQIKDGFYPTFVGEVGRQIGIGQGALRPFTELRWGVETMARIGVDYTLGSVGQGELLVRDPVTGQRYRAIYEQAPGFSYVLGGDVSFVENSALLPEDRGYKVEQMRTRVRAGLHWQGEQNSTFYGLTYLSEEFDGQPEGQVVGSIRLKISF